MLLHLYNQGNNQGLIFFNRENYLFFLRKVKSHLIPSCDILAWCLMPNHFHFLIWIEESPAPTNELTINAKHKRTTETKKLEESISTNSKFSNNLRIMLSSYTQAINKQNRTTGSLFRQNSKLKNLSSFIWNEQVNGRSNYALNCFNYIHQNPLKAGLVNKMEDWEFSSFQDYMEMRPGKLINYGLAHEIINFDKDNFYSQSYIIASEKGIF